MLAPADLEFDNILVKSDALALWAWFSGPTLGWQFWYNGAHCSGLVRRAGSLTVSFNRTKRLIGYVVPVPARQVTVRELRFGLGRSLPAYAIPSWFEILDSLPLLATGKVDRRALPSPGTDRPDLGPAYSPPTSPAEEALAVIWRQVLGVDQVGVHDDFFELGGNSLSGAQMLTQVRDSLGRNLPLTVLLRAPTISLLASTVHQPGSETGWDIVVPLRTGGNRPPLFCVHGVGGEVVGYADLAHHLGPEQPVYGLQAAGLDGGTEPDHTIQEMAARYIDALRSVQPRGPYHVASYCYAAWVVYEMACQLEAQGEPVGLVAIIEGQAPARFHSRIPLYHPRRLKAAWRSIPFWVRDYRRLGATEVRRRARVRAALSWRDAARGPGPGSEAPSRRVHYIDLDTVPEQNRGLVQLYRVARSQYKPRPYGGRLVLYRAQGQTISQVLLASMDPEWGWGVLASGGVEVRVVEGSHRNLHLEPYVASLAAALSEDLTASNQRHGVGYI